MTVRIARSDAVALDFESAVASYIAALEEHRFVGNAAPTALSIVEQAVRRVQYPIGDGKPDDFVADYEIYDDTPPPPSLEERKQRMRAESSMLELQEIDALMPQGKRRLLEMRASEAYMVPEDGRTLEQKQLIQTFEALGASMRAIHMAAAHREAEIDDLND